VADLNQMLFFARIVARGSLSAAARDLRLPPSTVSRKLAALEQRLGVRLLERTTRRLRLTEAGAAYYERCALIASQAEDADEAVRAHARAPRGTLRMSAPPMLGALFLGVPLSRYLDRYPGMRVEVVLGERPVDLAAESFDLAIRLAAAIDTASYVVRKLGTSTPVLCASPLYVKKHGTPASLADIPRHTLISIAPRQPEITWSFADEAANIVSLPVTPRVHVNNTWLMREMCLQGAGIAMLPWFLVARDLQENTLIRLLPDMAPRPLDVCVIMPRGSPATPKVRAFLDILYRYVAETRPWQ
jgi:DNA-binding transcriptional LysR family regulator